MAQDDPAAEGHQADGGQVAAHAEELAEEFEDGAGDGAMGGREEGQDDEQAAQHQQDAGDVELLIEGQAFGQVGRRAFFAAR
ncbi:MAG: hypothetical protein HZB20_01035 [Chloroflexi bacterium]|nr:hypothetical protein [Chloroflexota bacterium]